MKQDISTKRDIEQLVKEFYADLLTVPDVQPVFAGIDFEHHVPRIVAFWSMVLLDEEGYKTNVFDKHLHLPIQPRHFDIWLESFTNTVDRLFTGEKAELAKQRATVLTFTFKSKWSHLKGNH